MIHASSRYARGLVVKSSDGRQVVLPRRQIPRTNYPDNEVVTVIPGMTLFNLADKYGLGPENWWVLAEFNGITDALAPLKPGTILLIPSQRTLHEDVLR